MCVVYANILLPGPHHYRTSRRVYHAAHTLRDNASRTFDMSTAPPVDMAVHSTACDDPHADSPGGHRSVLYGVSRHHTRLLPGASVYLFRCHAHHHPPHHYDTPSRDPHCPHMFHPTCPPPYAPPCPPSLCPGRARSLLAS
ncbi:hypothetical protein JTE90_007312 [Oedothorax gibbosus]|uniref:Uncharacterized protein n=1 Tax=Oedothorax gibbosus TaxID=931172 RepID=A0AAV6TEF3_9ARAC|nr:hypothetical protein JTE90_007312 [Oedothorax gibbosus]